MRLPAPLQVSGLMSFKKEEAQPLVQQALEAIDDMNNALALTKDVRRRLLPQIFEPSCQPCVCRFRKCVVKLAIRLNSAV